MNKCMSLLALTVGALLVGSSAHAVNPINPAPSLAIESCHELQNMRGGKYHLAQDIDCTPGGVFVDNGGNFLPIGGAINESPFRGTFDGKGHSITGLLIQADAPGNSKFLPQGLFGKTENATIKNLHLVNVSVIGGIAEVGGVVGRATKHTRIENVHVDSDTQVGSVISSANPSSLFVTAFSTTGGLLGSTDSTTWVDRCSVNAVVLGVIRVGGLVGTNRGVIMKSFSDGKIVGTNMTTGPWVGVNVDPLPPFSLTTTFPSIVDSYSKAQVVIGYAGEFLNRKLQYPTVGNCSVPVGGFVGGAGGAGCVGAYQ